MAADFIVFAEDVPAVLFVSAALTQSIESRWSMGEWEEALLEVELLREWQLEHPPSPIIKLWIDTLLSRICNDLEMFDAAETILMSQIDLVREIDEIQLTLPILGEMIRVTAQSAERCDETLALIQELVERIDKTPTIQGERFDPLLFAHGWLLQQRPLLGQDEELSHRLTKSLGEYIEEYDSSLQIPLSHATFAEAQGNIAIDHQKLSQAKAHYDAAVTHWHSANRPYDLLRALSALNDLCSQLGEDVELSEELSQEVAKLTLRWQQVKTTELSP